MEKKKAAEGEEKARPRFLFSFCWEEQGLFKKKKKGKKETTDSSKRNKLLVWIR